MSLPEIHDMINKWYGMKLDITVRTREEQIRCFEAETVGLVSQWCWDIISKNTHLVLLWMQSATCVDLIVRFNGELRFVQDICFKDAYETPALWHMAIKKIIDHCAEVYVVFHDD
jgi:hypothetical protein